MRTRTTLDVDCKLTKNWNRWVKTGNGQNYADVVGVKEPPMTIEQSVIGVIAQVCLPIHTEITKLTKFG